MSHPASTPDGQPQSPAPYSLPEMGGGAYPTSGSPVMPEQPVLPVGSADYQYGVVPFGGNPPTAPPPVFGQPSSASPMSGMPMSGMPMSGMPVSGHMMSGPPPMGPPMSGPAMMGPPAMGPPTMAMSYPVSPQPQPAASGGNRSAATIVLSVASALLLTVAMVMTILYVQKRGDLARANTAHSTAIGERDKQIKQLNNDVRDKTDELDRSRQDLTGSQNQTAELKKQKDTIRQCLVLLGEANAAQQKGDAATAKAKETEATPICDQAFQYLG